MNNNQVSESHGWRDFFIGIVIMLVVILIAYAANGNDPTPVGPCNYQDASGLGC